MRIPPAVFGVIFCVASAAVAPALAQPYPSKPVRMVVAFPPGGTSDFVGRVVAAKLGEFLGQPIVIDNKPGASGLIGTQDVARSAPDGYTLLLAPSDFTVVPGLQAKPPYDAVKDFAPIGMVIEYSHVLVAHPNVQANNARELIALAKANPAKLNFASGGNGATNHISGEWFKRNAGVDITHVPYKGNGPAIIDLLADRVQLLFTSTGPVEAHLKSGKLKAIAVTGTARLPSMPDVQTVAESALPGYQFKLWYGLVAPAGTPRAIIDRLNADLRKTMASPEVREKLASIGGTYNVGSPDEMASLLTTELGNWTKLARDVGIKVE
ncbi:MAG TPA: tripartite tricarboxylate transporter substrate binding protein [Casimicrobiaceae bacterium]|nr:tripartite tricarboxylate transporter substrate binding protein [Casimicrobiaceae bacterium]